MKRSNASSRFTIPLMSYRHLIAAGARALRSRMVRVEAPEGAIDVCGTGGDGAHTLNISTAVPRSWWRVAACRWRSTAIGR